MQPLKSQTTKEGGSVTFEAKFKGHPEPIVKWYHDDSEIQSSTDFEISYSDEGTTLSIAEVFPEDAGKYKCVLTNADGSEVSEARLNVQRKYLGIKWIQKFCVYVDTVRKRARGRESEESSTEANLFISERERERERDRQTDRQKQR